jgi:hypothetical protein
MVRVDVLMAMQTVDWEKLVNENGMVLYGKLPYELKSCESKWNPGQICYMWKSECPTCFDIGFKCPRPVFSVHQFQQLMPTFAVDQMDQSKNAMFCHYLWKCPVVSDIDGQIVYHNVQLVIHKIHPLITKKEAKLFYFRSMEEVEHKNYVNISERNRFLKQNYNQGASYTFVAVQTAAEDGSFSDSGIPSITLLDALTDILPLNGEQVLTEVSRDLLVATRECVSQ